MQLHQYHQEYNQNRQNYQNHHLNHFLREYEQVKEVHLQDSNSIIYQNTHLLPNHLKDQNIHLQKTLINKNHNKFNEEETLYPLTYLLHHQKSDTS